MDAVSHRIPHRAGAVTLAAAAALILAACAAGPPGVAYSPSQAARAAPAPRLLTQAEIAEAAVRAGTAATPGAEVQTLAARADGLRARAAALSAPVLAGAEAARLGGACLARPDAGITCPP